MKQAKNKHNTARPQSDNQGCPVINLETYRFASNDQRGVIRASAPVFEPGLYPGTDYHIIGRQFAALASYVREGKATDPRVLAQLLDRYSATCIAICRNVREIESRMLKAEKRLREPCAPKGLPGATLAKAIRPRKGVRHKGELIAI